MAFSMKTGTIPDACVIACVGDGGVFRDVKSDTTASLEGTVTVATGTWDGVSRDYLNVPDGTNTGADFGAGVLAATDWSTVTGGTYTFVFLVEDLAATGTSTKNVLCGDGTNNVYFGRSGYSGTTFRVATAGGASTTTTVAATGRYFIACVLDQGATGPFYVAADTASSVGSNVAAGDAAGAGGLSIRYIGRDANAAGTSCNAKIYGVLVFNTGLTSGQLDTLVSDVYGTLFTEGTSVAPLAMGAYSRMRNG